ncbi:hypothetical protein CRUP_016737 [Coryphaenoides rupestris]|nr:hypothetical protein CRUP_016737 [Coryphaenoides rupestris]
MAANFEHIFQDFLLKKIREMEEQQGDGGGLPDPQRTHVMWGFSKDFAMAGVRLGTLYTENKDVMEALCQLAYLHGVPGSTQHQMTRLLQDRARP